MARGGSVPRDLAGAGDGMSLRACRVSKEVADDFVRRLHRHHAPSVGWRFGIGAWHSERGLVGVIVVGRAVARGIDQERVVEVTRCCTDGTRNACSFLYAAAARVAEWLGFDAIITYTLDAESGASLRALVWWGEESATPGKSWSVPSRPRDTERKGDALGAKTRWLKLLGDFSAVPQTRAASSEMNLSLFSEIA